MISSQTGEHWISRIFKSNRRRCSTQSRKWGSRDALSSGKNAGSDV